MGSAEERQPQHGLTLAEWEALPKTRRLCSGCTHAHGDYNTGAAWCADLDVELEWNQRIIGGIFRDYLCPYGVGPNNPPGEGGGSCFQKSCWFLKKVVDNEEHNG